MVFGRQSFQRIESNWWQTYGIRVEDFSKNHYSGNPQWDSTDDGKITVWIRELHRQDHLHVHVSTTLYGMQKEMMNYVSLIQRQLKSMQIPITGLSLGLDLKRSGRELTMTSQMDLGIERRRKCFRISKIPVIRYSDVPALGEKTITKHSRRKDNNSLQQKYGKYWVAPPDGHLRQSAQSLRSSWWVARVHHDGYGVVSPGRDTNTGQRCRWASRFAHGCASEPQDSPRAHDADHVCDFHSVRHVRGDPGYLVFVRFRKTRFVMDFGDGVSHTAPIFEGYALPHVIFRLDLTVRDISDFLMKFLTERRYFFTIFAERRIGRDVKEKLYLMSFDYDTELKSTAESSDKNQTYELPDRNIIFLDAESFRCTSFLPVRFIGIQVSGIHDTSFRSNMKCYVNIRKELYANVVLSRGTTMS